MWARWRDQQRTRWRHAAVVSGIFVVWFVAYTVSPEWLFAEATDRVSSWVGWIFLNMPLQFLVWYLAVAVTSPRWRMRFAVALFVMIAVHIAISLTTL